MRLRRSVVPVVFAMFAGSPLLLAQQPPAAQQIAYDYSALYEALNPSIVKVHADGSSGSGFLVTAAGLIATNHHVVRNSRYLTVQFADGRKVQASVVTLDPRFDLAILKVHPQVAAGVVPLRLLPEERDREVKAGTPVLAFGSPLSQTFLMTQGIVAKVEENVVLGDFLIQPGNSGGPLVTLKGDVVGVNTFAEGGISGAVRVTALRRMLTSPAVLGYAGVDPPATLLPTVPAERYPTEVLKEKIVGERLELKTYQLNANKFTITAMTPVLVGKSVVQEDLMQARNRFQRRGKKVNDPTWREVDTPFYEWARNATSVLDNVVTFEIKPDFGSTTGSKWATALSAVAAGLNRTAMSPVHQTMEFKAEFLDFKLYKDGQLVTPVHPGRSITEASLQGDYYTFIDEAYSGMYQYTPDIFLSGGNYRIEVFDAREPGRVHYATTLASAHPLIQQLRRDFAEAISASQMPLGVGRAPMAPPVQAPDFTTQPPATSQPAAAPLAPNMWATNLAGITVELKIAGDTALILFAGGDLAGVRANLRKTATGFSGSYQSEKCGVTGAIELRPLTNAWQGAITRIDCSTNPPTTVRTALVLTKGR